MTDSGVPEADRAEAQRNRLSVEPASPPLRPGSPPSSASGASARSTSSRPGGAQFAQAAEALEEIGALFEEFAAFTERGLDALGSGDLGVLNYTLAARGELMPRTEQLIARFIAQHNPDGDAPESALEELYARARSIRQHDTQLQLALAAALQDVGQAMEALVTEEIVLSAYGQRPGTEGRQIDLRR